MQRAVIQMTMKSAPEPALMRRKFLMLPVTSPERTKRIATAVATRRIAQVMKAGVKTNRSRFSRTVR